jgi:peptide methionine sulfoxide reductase msrA/msrB
MTKSVMLAGGCFWCVEHDLREADGVTSIVSGYAGGDAGLTTPTYEQHHGYKEAVLVEYDETKTSYKKILQFFIDHIDPTDDGGQFGDRGESYMSAIFYKDEEEHLTAKLILKELNDSHVYAVPSKVRLLEYSHFYPAEEYHQRYAEKNPLRYVLYRNGSGREAFVQKTCAIREEKKVIWKD